MTPIYQVDSVIEAHLLLNLLHAEGISAHLTGADLLGAAGELPVLGLVQVWVDDSRAQAARALVLDWINAPIPEESAWEAPAGDESDSVLIPV